MQMFYNSKLTDLLGTFERQEVVFDTSNCVTANHAFCGCLTKRLPVIDLSKASTNSLFYKATNLWYIEKIISAENTVWHNDAFGYLSALIHCPFEGVIASDINVQHSPLLDDETIISLSVALQNLWENLDENGKKDRTLTVHPDVLQRLKELPYPIDDYYNPVGTCSCFDIIVDSKGWNVA